MQTYSMTNMVVVVNGVEIGGFAAGDDAIQARRRSEGVMDEVGADGKMSVSISADKSGEIVLKLQSTSPSNKFLGDLVNVAEAVGGAFVPVVVTIQDTYRNDMASGIAGYIKKMPDLTRGEKAGTQEWTIVVERLDVAFGDPSGGVFF